MATTFDGENLLITLNAGGIAHEVDAQIDLYSDWKEWVKIGDNSKYAQAFDTDGGSPLTPGLTQGSYYFIRNDLGWRIKPAEEDATITMTGNLVPRDSTIPVFVPTTGAFTVGILGLQPITQSVGLVLDVVESNSFNGKVSIDIINGSPGTVYPQGTDAFPVDNWVDAVTIAQLENITEFQISGTVTLTSAFNGYVFRGKTSSDNDRVILNGQSANGSLFKFLKISGAASSSVIEANSCRLDTLSGVRGIFRGCGFENDITLIAGASTFDKCYSEVPGNTKPWLDLNGGNSKINVRNYVGGLDLRGVSHASALVTCDMDGGRLLLNTSCTGGEIVAGGHAEFTDNSAGSVIVDTVMTPERQMRILKATAYRQYTNPSTGKLDIHDDDDVLDQSVDIYEDDGVTSWDGTGPIVRRNKIVE